MEKEDPTTSRSAEVRILEDGPIKIKGYFSFKNSSGKIVSGEQELCLCGCGKSASQPWCDGTHKNPNETNSHNL
jgi:CDGSH-type Zn-finger protein